MNNNLENEIRSVSQIKELLNSTEWFLLTGNENAKFANQIFSYIVKNTEKFTQEDYAEILPSINYLEIDEDLIEKLMKKSLEIKVPLIASENMDFDFYTENEKKEYLNLIAYSKITRENFETLCYSMWGNSSLEKALEIYTEKNNNQINENFHIYILKRQPETFFEYNNLTIEQKKSILNNAINSDEHGYFLYSLLKKIADQKTDKNKIFVDEEILPILLNCIVDKTNKKELIMKFIEVVEQSHHIKETVDVIQKDKDIKEKLIHIFSEKVQDREIPKSNLKNGEKENFLQYLILRENNNFVTQLCKEDKEILKVFNHSITEVLHGFSYSKSVLDAALADMFSTKFIENLLTYQVINNQVSKRSMEKTCAFFFKAFQECKNNDVERYNSLLNVINLFSSKMFNKYFDYHSLLLSDKKINDLTIIKNMKNITDSLKKNASHIISKNKSKI